MKSFVHLARGLGFSVGSIGATNAVTEEGEAYSGWQISMSGAELSSIPVRLQYKKCPGTNPQSDQRCNGFKVTELAGEHDYYGFEVTGNGRMLMDDFVVTHNVSPNRVYTRSRRNATTRVLRAHCQSFLTVSALNFSHP